MVEELSPAEVHERLDDEELTIVDIRQPDEYRHGHVPGAINVPMTEFARRVEEIEWGEEVVMVCPIGQSSLQAARLLGSYEGVDADTVKSMAGGYDAWEYELEGKETTIADEEAPF